MTDMTGKTVAELNAIKAVARNEINKQSIAAQAARVANIKFRGVKQPGYTNYEVIINGEHRATFRSNKRWRRAGYDITAPGDIDISLYKIYRGCNDFVTIADFEHIVRECLKLGRIPTRTEIERVQLITLAEKDHRAWLDEQSRKRAEVRDRVIRTALTMFIESNPAAPLEKMARDMLSRHEGGGWL